MENASENTEPLREVLELVTNKWTAMILCSLKGGMKRYSELQQELPSISQKMLTQTLKNLERDGMVERKSYPVAPPKVEYSLTPLGRSLIEPLSGLLKWAEEHIQEVRQARENYQQVEK